MPLQLTFPALIGLAWRPQAARISRHLTEPSGAFSDLVANINRVHAGGSGGLESEVGIFVDQACLWWDAELASCFEKDVGGRFMVLGIFCRDDRVKPIEAADFCQLAVDHIAIAAAGHGQGNLPPIIFGDGDDLREWQQAIEPLQKGQLFFLGRLGYVNLHALFARQEFDDVARWHPSQGIEPLFVEDDTVAVHGFAPSQEMDGHGVGQRAVTVKNQAAIGAAGENRICQVKTSSDGVRELS